MAKREKPKIVAVETIAKSNLFTIESLDLEFSNGVKRTYERMQHSGREAVMMVPITQQGDLLLIREYAAGTEEYELGFPKGLVDPEESPQQAANRELKEEIGMGGSCFTPLKKVLLAPSYFCSEMTLFLVEGLYPETLSGDEPEPLEVVKWPLNQADELLLHMDFSEARNIAALMLAQRHLSLRKNHA